MRSIIGSMKPGWLKNTRSLSICGAVGPDFCLCARDVLAILPAAGIRAERAGDERQRAAHAVGRHLPQRVGQQRMPIAIAPIDRQLRPVLGQFALERRDQLRGSAR